MKKNTVLGSVMFLLIVLLLGGCAEKPMEGTPYTVMNLTGGLPDGWTSVTPGNSLRSGQLSLAPSEGDTKPGEVIIFFVGPNEKGIEDSLSRWASQFEAKYGDPIRKEDMNRQDFRSNTLKMIMVNFSGTMGRFEEIGVGEVPMRENWACTAGVVDTPSGPFFFKGTGPVKTMTDQLPNFKKFLQSLKYSAM